MQRFVFGTVSVIILLLVFAFLWTTNPLYAFVGGVVFLVFMLVGFAFLLNLSRGETSPEEEIALKPRRTGQFNHPGSLEKPEESWDEAAGSRAIRRSTSQPDSESVLSLGGSQGFHPESPANSVSPPAPVVTEQDFDNMTIEELTEWTNTPAPPSEPEHEQVKKEDTRRMDTATFFAVEVDEEEADDLFAPEIISEIVEKEMEFDRVADDMKQKMEAGTFGNSAEDVQNFFKVAIEKASIRNEGSDTIDEAKEDGDAEDWLAESMREGKAKKGELAFLDELLEEETEEEPAEEDLSNERVGEPESNHFDLMGMVGTLAADKQQSFFALMTEVPIGDQTETQLIRLYEGLISDEDSVNQVSEAQFTAYYPRQASAGTEYGFYVYAHLPDALIQSDIQAFESQLGGRVPKPKVATQSAKIADNEMLTVMIHCDKLNFSQIGAMQAWKAPFVRFDFKFTANEVQIDDFVEGRIAILMGMIEIASIDFHLGITPTNPLAIVTAIPDDPLSANSFDASTPVSIYQKIFISYSHKDVVIAEQYRKIQTMTGNIVFMDTHSIRAGQDWEIALKQFIDEADVFQLFWSEHSANSEHVKFEWDYALTQRCPETRCVQFIRPAYWQKPLTTIPNELAHIHFAYVDMETD